MDSQSSSVCVISLDALDLNFLKDRFEHQQNRHHRTSSKQDVCFNDKFYYEFEVKTDEDLDVNEEPINYEEDIEYIQCHICKIDVPKQFYYEHRNSVKHETNIKIANEAIQRLQKHVNCHCENNYNKNNSSIYFCTVCAITMDSKEKINHENSIGHKNSVIVEKILIDFLYIYSNKEYGENKIIKYKTSNASTSIVQIDSNVHKKSGNTNISEEKSIIKINENEANITGLGDNINFSKDDTDNIKYKMSTVNKSTTEITNCNTQEKITQIPENKKISDEMSISKINENKSYTTLEDYIAILKEKYISQEMNFKVFNEFTLDITTIDESVVRVSVENFHGFVDLSRRFSTCILCKEIFSKVTRQEHILTYNHKRLLCLPLRNKHCLRYISDIRNHCVLCNMELEGSKVTSHGSSTGHLNNIKKFLIFENKQNNNITSHSHLSNIQSVDTAQAKDTSQNSFEKAINMVPNMTTAKKEDKLIVLQAQNVQNTNSDTKLNNDQLKQVENIYEKQFCSYCNVFISIKGFQKHSNTVKHIMNTLSDLHYLMNATASDDYICRICDEKVTNSIDDVKQHTALSSHLQIYNTLLQNNKIEQLNEQTLFCTPCNEMIFIKNELLHINSKEHKILNSNNDNETVDKALNTVPSPVEANTSTTRDDPGPFFCNICNVNVPNTKNCIEVHIKGRPHIKNMNNLFHKKVSNKTSEKEPKENNSVAAVIEGDVTDTGQKSQTEKFQEFFYLFLMRGLSVNAVDVNECPPLVYTHYSMHSLCFKEIFKILKEHGCEVDYFSGSSCVKQMRIIPDAILASITSDPSTSPIMLPYSLQCDPEYLLKFALENGLLGRFPLHVQEQLLAMIGLNTDTNAEALPYIILPLKHLCRQAIRHFVRCEGKSKSYRDLVNFLNVIRIPKILKDYLCYL